MDEFTLIESLDEAQVIELHRLFQLEWWTRGRSLEQVRGILDQSQFVFGYEHQPAGKLAAFARILTDGIVRAVLYDVIVAAEYRGLGLGKRLLDAVCKHPRLADMDVIELCCAPELKDFYSEYGFRDKSPGLVFMRRERPSQPEANPVD